MRRTNAVERLLLCVFSRQSVWNEQRRLFSLVSAGAGAQPVDLRLSGLLLSVRGRPDVRRQLFGDVSVPLWTDRRSLHPGRVDVRWRGRLSRWIGRTAELPSV